MPLTPLQRKTLNSLLLASFVQPADLDMLLKRDLDVLLSDLTPPDLRPNMFLNAVVKLDAMRRIPDLINAIFEDRPADTQLREKLADLFNDVWPEGEPDKPHLHLLVDSVAFVNRDHLRTTISGLVDSGNPRVMLLRGRSLAGSSHCRYLIQHVAKEKGGIDVALLNFDWVQPLTPPVAMQILADGLDFGTLPQRNDLIAAGGGPDLEAPQLTATLCNWFLGKARERQRVTQQGLWLLIDNAHRDTVPAPMREFVAKLIQVVGSGTVENLHLFVLGTERALPILLPFAVEELDVAPLGRPDIVAYLSSVMTIRPKSLDEFASVDAAADAILAACDLDKPNAEALLTMTKGLTELVRRVR